MHKAMVVVMAAVVSAGAMVGCRSYSQDDFRAALREAGVPDNSIACVEQGMQQKNIPIETYRDNRSDATMQTILIDCIYPPDVRAQLSQSAGSVPSPTTSLAP
jgi:hypothetical protein